ncbi:GNAT family N-acetyltransferase [Actinomadura rupiterrae]|uniref:GNAT family N-acetyltransferase n=1 Tax=Actinomadura rupiterrae TaxID=559627 RepID=UPI0020A5F2DD|nr:GNAT family N-acetyltransferase [Actinomadura rupiterrae]MCP2343038.1 ribosomal-protein-alanine N-acetyltransferase [Actinomadura rupiterrae]
MSVTRPASLGDAAELAELYGQNREFLAPWEPARDEEFFTEAAQRAGLAVMLDEHARGKAVPRMIVDEDGAIAGRINLVDIVRGAFQSGNLGYWVSGKANGRGLATRAVGEIVRIAFEDMDLHRVQAATLVHNARSQKVLERNGFVRYGTAPDYCKIAGRWQDHTLFQLIRPDA